jgi:hypothetical protein
VHLFLSLPFIFQLLLCFSKGREILFYRHSFFFPFQFLHFFFSKLRGDLEDAEELYRKVLASKEKTLGAQHAQTASTINSLASVLEELEYLDEAEG